jgi:hypothetical protein
MSTNGGVSAYRYPSEEFRPLPAWRIEAPASWRPTDAPDCLAVLYDPEASEPFRVNVTVTVDRVGAAVELDAVATATLEQAKAEYPDYEIDSEKVVEVDGQPASLRFGTFGEPRLDGGQLLQMQVVFFAPGDGAATRDLVQISAACLAEDAERYAPVFVEIAKSFRFGDGG